MLFPCYENEDHLHLLLSLLLLLLFLNDCLGVYVKGNGTVDIFNNTFHANVQNNIQCEESTNITPTDIIANNCFACYIEWDYQYVSTRSNPFDLFISLYRF